MGYESRVLKERRCRDCGGVLYITAPNLRSHALLCKRAKASGLVLPTQVSYDPLKEFLVLPRPSAP